MTTTQKATLRYVANALDAGGNKASAQALRDSAGLHPTQPGPEVEPMEPTRPENAPFNTSQWGF